METIKKLLDTEIESEFEALDELELGSEQHKIAVEGLVKLIDRDIEIKKIDVDENAKNQNREFEREKFEGDISEKRKNREFEEKKFEDEMYEKRQNREFEREKFDEEMSEKRTSRKEDNDFRKSQRKSDRLFKALDITVGVLAIVVPVGKAIWGTRTCLRFEETGTVTTTPGRAHTNSLFR